MLQRKGRCCICICWCNWYPDHLWVAPAILSSLPCLLENEGSYVKSLGGHQILFWEYVLNSAGFPLTTQRRMPFEKRNPIYLTTAYCSGSLSLLSRLNGEMLSLWSPKVKASRDDAKQIVVIWVWNTPFCHSTWRCMWITILVFQKNQHDQM